MKARIAVVLILVFILGIFACGKKSSTSSGTDLLPVDFVKKLDGLWCVMNAELAGYDTTTGLKVGSANEVFVFEALGEVVFGTGTAYAETITGPSTGTLYWVADEDEAAMYDGLGDASPTILLKSPLRDGKDWAINPNDPPEDEVTAEILSTDTTLFLLGGVYHDVVRVQLTAEQATPLYQVQEYFFAQDLGYIVFKILVYTRTDKLFLSLIYELEHMGTGGAPKVDVNPQFERMLKEYEPYLSKPIFR